MSDLQRAHNTNNVRPKNWSTPVALVLLWIESSHGYELMKRLEEFGFEAINSGTLYRTLRQMKNDGLCKSKWVTSNGRADYQVYSVTDAGEEYLASWFEGRLGPYGQIKNGGGFAILAGV